MTTVSGVRDDMFPMLTRGDGFAVDDLGPVGGARHGELAPRQCLARPRDAGPKLVVAEHPVERAGPGGGIERWDEQSRFARVHELRVAARGRRDHRDAQRHRLEQRLRQAFDPGWQRRDRGEAVEGERPLRERHQHDTVPRGHRRRRPGELLIGPDADEYHGDGTFERRQRAEQDLLVLTPRDDGDHRQSCVPDRLLRKRQLRRRGRSLDAVQVDAVGNDAQPGAGMQPPPQRPRDRGADSDRAVGSESDGDQRRRERQGHRPARHDEGSRQPSAPPQPRTSTAVAGGVAVHDVHALGGNYAGDGGGDGAKAREVERDVLERWRGGDVAGEERSGWAADQDAVAALGKRATQTEDGLRRAGALTLMRELQNRETRGTLRHVPKLVILGPRCTAWWPRITSYPSRATVDRSAAASRWFAGSRHSVTA